MKKAELLAKLATITKGANVRITWQRTAKTRKECAANIEKLSEFVGRVGISFENLAANEGREVGPLPWGVWGEYPYTIEHKGNTYLRVYQGTSKNNVPHVQFFRNGQPVEREAIAAELLASELPKANATPPDCFVVNVEDIVAIG